MRHSTRRYISFAELSDKLGGRSRSSIYRDLEQGRLPNPVKIGARLYWCEEEIDGHLNRHRIGSN